MNNPNPFNKYIFTFYDKTSLVFKFRDNVWRLSTFSRSSKESQSQALVHHITNFSFDMLEYANQIRHEIKCMESLTIKCAVCDKKLIMFNILDMCFHSRYHKTLSVLQQYSNYFTRHCVSFNSKGDKILCSICDCYIINNLYFYKSEEECDNDNMHIIAHLTEHSTQVKNIAVSLLADKNSPFHVFDGYIMKNILVHCAYEIN